MSWFVRNVREMKWWDRGPRGFVTDFHGDDDAQVGVNLFVLGPGEPMSMYHWEADQEGFLVLSGEALLIVEEEEHPLRQWDYFHCPAPVPHTIVGAGSGPSAILAIGAREKQDGADWGGYPYSEAAMKHDASAEEDTTEPQVAYARFPARRDGEFREDWLPT
ncbi:MAG TPA: cupin domain-containing protein [Gaiellaceae bacterium]|nr:cupin domain-containing protein [Gaiellaceae bacterium]